MNTETGTWIPGQPPAPSRPARITVCEGCLSPVYKSGDWHYHEVIWRGRRFPFLSTIAREVTEVDVEQAKAAGGTHEESPARRLVTTTEGL